MLEAKAKDQGHKAQVLSKKKKKKVFTKLFQAISTKKRFPKNFSSAPQNFNNPKKYCCPRAEDRPIFEDLRPRGQGQGLYLRGQGLQNLSSRPRTSSRTPPLTIGDMVQNFPQSVVKVCTNLFLKQTSKQGKGSCCRPVYQRWSPRGRPWPRGRPRGQILKSLALASRPQVLEN